MRAALLALTALLRAHVTACPPGCKCLNYTWPQYYCKTIHMELPDGKLDATCTEPYALESFPPLPTRNAFTVKLNRCLPPPAGWGAALQALGANQTRQLKLQVPEQPLLSWKPEHFKDLNGLEQLHLTQRSCMPSDLLSKLHGLRQLELWTVTLPPTLTLPESLIELTLGNCDLTKLSERALATAPGLLRLIVNGYDERMAPGAIAGLTQLQSVNLVECLLGKLPPRWLGALPALQAVELRSCKLRELPADLLTGSNLLQNLSFAHNLLEVLPPTLLEGLSALRRLNLQGNKLTVLPETLLAPSRHLKYIILSNNHLSGLNQSVFSTKSNQSNQLRELATLDLSFNRFNASNLEQLNFLIFGNKSLELDLRHNSIKTVTFPSESARPSARVLLAGNPLACDCHLHNVLRHAAPNGTLVITDASCRSPKELRWQPLSTLPRAQLACPLAAPACPRDCACARRPGLAAGLLTLACPAPPPAASWPDPAHFQLRASTLRLTAAPSTFAFALPPHCRRLSLAALNLTQLPLAPTMLQLDQLDLRDNLLQELPAGLPINSTRLLLSGNPLQCGCAAADAVARLKSAAELVDDWEVLRCPDGARLSHVTVEPCFVLPLGALVGLGAVSVGLALLAALLALRYARELRGWAAVRGLGCLWPAQPADADADAVDRGKCYDVFVSYAHGDERWVVGELAPRLERAGLRLCLHFRDWEAGGWIPAQIERSVRRARRTLLVVSARYLASGWAQHEWRAALAQARPRLVLLLLGNLPALPEELCAHMRGHTYVKVGDPWFWSKLRLALPRRPLAPAALAETARRDITQRLAFNDDELEQVSAQPQPALALQLLHGAA